MNSPASIMLTRHPSPSWLVQSTAFLLLTCGAARAQTPQYRTEFLNAPGSVADMNNQAEIACNSGLGSNERGAFVSRTQPFTLLPLPPGRISSWVLQINDLGVMVGAVSSFSSPEFSGIAAVWTPNGSGGYTVQELGALPGHASSNATALNNVGDIVGWSSDGSYRYPVSFFAGGPPLNLSASGIFDPQSINDARVIVDRSWDGKLLDLNTMTVQTLGVPQGFPTHYTALSGRRINAAGQVGSITFLATSGSCVQQAARHTPGLGWEIFGPCGISGGVGDMNDLGEMTMVWVTSSIVQLDGYGPVNIENLISAPVGQWFFPLYSVFHINNAHQLAGWAYNTTTNETGVVLLTPETPTITSTCWGDVAGAGCPCANYGIAGNGCANSVNNLGANLSGFGAASLANDSLVLAGDGMPNSSALYFQGTAPANGGSGLPFGDGLRCAGGAIVRLGTTTNVGGASSYPSGSDAPVSIRGMVGAPGSRHYQVWYRNAAAYCTASTFNLSNGLTVSWTL